MLSRPTMWTMILGPTLVVVLSACGAGTAELDSSSGAPTSDASAPDTESSPSRAPRASDATPAIEVPAILDFTADTVSGDAYDGASLAGKPAVLWFWAPWCPTCRGQIDGVSALAGQYGDEVSFVGVGSLDEAPAIEGFAADVPANMEHLLDPEGAVWRHFGIVEQSTYVVLDAKSRIVSEGYLDDHDLADLVGELAG